MDGRNSRDADFFQKRETISTLSAGIHFQADHNEDSFKKGKGKKKKKRTDTGTKFGKVGGKFQQNIKNSPGFSESKSGTELNASDGYDITGSKSLTDLGDLPIPVKKANKVQVVSGWNDDGLIDDWNFDEVNNLESKASKQTVNVPKVNNDFDDFDDFEQYDDIKLNQNKFQNKVWEPPKLKQDKLKSEPVKKEAE